MARELLHCPFVDGLDSYQLQALSQSPIVPYALVMLTASAHWSLHPTRVGPFFWASVLHPLLFPTAFIYAVLSSRGSQHAPDSLFLVFYAFLLLGIVGMIVSTFPFRGRWWLAAVHCVTLLAGLWFWFIGSMTVAHDWI